MRLTSLSLVSALALLAAPLAAQDLSQAEQFDERVSAAISLGFDDQVEQANRDLLTIAAEADAAIAAIGGDKREAAALLRSAGNAYYYAAQNHDPEWNDEAGQALEVEWLSKSLDRLERALALEPENFTNSYEYRGVAGQLWQHGERLKDARWQQWSAARVAANRMRMAEYPEDYFEQNMVAEALYDHGWLTSDKALLAEADALLAAMPEDERGYGALRKQRAVEAGEEPY
ncbi:MAG: hypothetical protein R3E18_00525 [Sphingomonadaceae bacterium]|nr:hypothetical protein [Sphingomonadaceae bacterium]